MQRNCFWSGRYRTDLMTFTHVYFVADKKDFEMVQKEVRAEKYKKIENNCDNFQNSERTSFALFLSGKDLCEFPFRVNMSKINHMAPKQLAF